MKSLKLITLMVTGSLLLTATAAVADEVIIIHRSGKIQTLQIDSAADPVEQVSFRRKAPETVAAPQTQATPSAAAVAVIPPAASTAPASAPAAKAAAPAKAPEKPGVKIKWAEPMDAKY